VSSDFSSATMQVTLTNTTPTAVGASLTSFAFDAPTSVVPSNITAFTASGTGDDGDWTAQLDATTGNLVFDIGATTGQNLGGGTAASGVQLGNTGTFTFTFEGTGLNALIEANFGGLDFFSRFQEVGPDGEDSDKVVTTIVYNNNNNNGGGGEGVVPEPSTLVLAIGCIAPLAAIRVIRRRRQARANAA
jgi:hypothetical protein